jgi:uncharacterized membrane protein
MKPDTSSPKRSIVKAISWESISTLATMILAYLLFGDVQVCMVFGILSFIMKLVMFYWHERFWHQIQFGKQI